MNAYLNALNAKIANEERIKNIIGKSIMHKNAIVSDLPKIDAIIQSVLEKCKVQDELTIKYNSDENISFEPAKNILNIDPQRFVWEDKYDFATIERQLPFVVAHEVGHFKYPHRKFAKFSSLLITLPLLGGLSVSKISAPLSLVYAASVLALDATISYALARRHEKWCDLYAKSICGAEGGIDFFECSQRFRNNATANFTVFQHFRYYDFSHPSNAERIAYLKEEQFL